MSEPRRPVLWAGLGALLLAAGACGVPTQKSPVAIGNPTSSAPTTSTLPTTVTGPGGSAVSTVTVYFVRANARLVPVTLTGAGLPGAVDLLLAGPTRSEIAAGIESALPAGTRLLSATRSGALARLDFTSTLASVSGQEQLLAFGQIVATATSVPGVGSVQVTVTGQDVNAPLPDGSLATGPVTRADYASLLG